ncbi:MAG: IS21-like element helper ATPase IstB [Planctomycetota bacterium]
MLNEPTLQKLTEMRLNGLAAAFREYLEERRPDKLTFDERFGMMIDREWNERQGRSLQRRLKNAKFRQQACVEDINYRHPRGLDRNVMRRLTTLAWMDEHENLVITGPTGVGKSWLACALGNQACRQGRTALYRRLPRLLQELALARADGSYLRELNRLAKVDLLVLDDWGLARLTEAQRHDLLDLLEDRVGSRSTIVTSQLPVKAWHEQLGDPTVADAILDRLIPNAHRIELSGPSIRPRRKDSQVQTPEPQEPPEA